MSEDERKLTHREWEQEKWENKIVSRIRNALIGIRIDSVDLYNLIIQEVYLVTNPDILNLVDVLKELEQ